MQTLELEPLAERANALFEARIKAELVSENPNHFLAIDVKSGDYEVSPDDLTPGDKLRARHPDALVFLRRVGDESAYFIGGGCVG